MKAFFRVCGSTRLAVTAMALLGALLATDVIDHDADVTWPVIGMLGVLAFNLACALVAQAGLRRTPGLLLLHVALLVLICIAAVGRSMRFEGRLEMLSGSAFEAGSVEVVTRGPWHTDRLSQVGFTQGAFSVDYAPGVRRGATRSVVHGVHGGSATVQVGDHRPLILAGYRFYTTHNKGLAVLLRWDGPGDASSIGAVHLPSYPLFEWRQSNGWQPPGGPALRFWYHRPAPLERERAWRLVSDPRPGRLVVNDGRDRHVLEAGDAVALDGGRLSFLGVRGWMGYRIYADPMLAALFWCAVAAAVGLTAHVMGVRWPRSVPGRRRLPVPVAREAGRG